MAVIINDFEVVGSAPAEEKPGPGQQENDSGQPEAPTPHNIERIIEHQLERFTRLWAH